MRPIKEDYDTLRGYFVQGNSREDVILSIRYHLVFPNQSYYESVALPTELGWLT